MNNNERTFDQKRTAKHPEAYAAGILKNNPHIVSAEVVSIDGETKTGMKRYTLRLTVTR